MKITFSKLVTTKPQVEVKADAYKSAYYNVNTAKTSGITINPKVFTDLDKIQIGGSKTKPTFTAEQKTAFLELVANASYTTVSLSNLYSYLSEKADNTADTPYKISLTDVPNEITGASSPSYAVEGTIQYALIVGGNANKYVDIILPNNVTRIDNYAFDFCSALTSVTIPNSVTSIGDYAFCNCSLTSVTIPNSVTSIGQYAFRECSALTSVTIPNSVTSISHGAFYRCDNLTSVTIPNSVIEISSSVFTSCRSLTSVTIGNSVTSIGQGTFSSCTSLTSVTIPSSVTSISQEAFYGCIGLTTINYTGTEEQWNAITKGSNWNNSVPSTCVINYNYQG